MADRILLDTNLLVLLVVGSTSDRLIATHKRTQGYDITSYRLLADIVRPKGTLVTTPHILTETSNLIRQCSEPARGQISSQFVGLINQLQESQVEARRVVSSRHFARLGLTDTAILALCTGQLTLLTDDLDLYLAGASAGLDCRNFAHLREGLTR